jgi:5-methylthioribose kinase
LHAQQEFCLDAGDAAALRAKLVCLRWISSDEPLISAEKAGEGNMNLVLRVRTQTRSVILKQSRAWVEKYPHIAAPRDRILVEAAFYGVAGEHPDLARAMPRMLGFDAASRLLMLEDLGAASDFTFLYSHTEPVSRAGLEALVRFAEHLHSATAAGGRNLVFANRDMRSLNHEHIFELPLRRGNGLDLDRITPGLATLAERLQIDAGYVQRVHALGGLYLADGGAALLHGDYFPGSWLRTAAGPRVIDPEFCFYGPPEFDIGVMQAHMIIAGAGFDALASYSGSLDRRLAGQFAGVEIMRRLIGVAQLQLARSLDEKAALLEESRRLVLA